MFYNKNKPVDKSSFWDILNVDSSSVFSSVIISSSIDIYNILTFGLHYIEPSSKMWILDYWNCHRLESLTE